MSGFPPSLLDAERACLLRATRAAAAAPNRMTMGGAGTGTPPVDVLVEPPLDVDELVLLEVEVEELVLLDVEELLLIDVLVPPPQLLELEVVDTLLLAVELLVGPPLVIDVEEK